MAECGKNITFEAISLWKYTEASWVFVMIFVPLVVLFGLVSNCAFVFVVYRVKFMRNITNIYLVNLAIADSSLLIVAFAQYVGDYIVCPEYDLRFSFRTLFGCALPNFLIYLCYYASLWTVTLVTMERYLAICHTFWHRIVSDHSRALRMVFAVWLVSLSFAGFALPYSQITLCALDSENESEILVRAPFCEFTCDWCAGALYMSDLFQFVFTFIVNLIMYILIVYQLGKATFPISKDENDIQANIRANHTRYTVAKMLIINGVIFFICLTPFSIANIENLCKFFNNSIFKEETVVLMSWFGRVLFMIDSAVNPLVYNASNPRYRLAFRQAFNSKAAVRYNVSVKTSFSHVTKV